MMKQSSRNIKKKQRSVSRSVIVIVLVVVVLVGGGSAYWHFHTHPAKPSAALNGKNTADNINFKPPTAEDKQYNNQHKNDLAQQQSTTPPTTDDKTDVTPLISSASTTGIRAYVPGVFENGGTCTATLTSDGQTITKTSSGFENASYTQCTPIDLSSTNLGNSTWSVTVTYSSSDASGTSQAATIKP